jgi:hypothetical protein
VIKTTERKAAMWLVNLSLLVGICKNFDIHYSGYIQTHCRKNKKIKRADQILPEVYGITLNRITKPAKVTYARGRRILVLIAITLFRTGNFNRYI